MKTWNCSHTDCKNELATFICLISVTSSFRKVFKNVRIIGFFFHIFWDVFNEMKDNFGQQCVKGASILPGK